MEIKLKNGTVLELWSDMREMPMRVLNRFQRQLAFDSSAGSTLEDMDKRLERLDMFLAAGRVADAVEERKNMRFGLWYMLQELNTKVMALASIIKAVDGKPEAVYTDEAVVKWTRVLQDSDITLRETEEALEKVRGKLESDMRAAIPSLRNSSAQLEAAVAVYKRALLMCEEVLEGKDNSKELAKINSAVLDSIAPLCLQRTSTNAILLMETGFEELCAALRLHGIHNPERLTVFAFHMQVEAVKQKNKPSNGESA